MKAILCSPEETISLGEKIGRKLRGGDMIAFLGDLGSGKTTFTRGLARGMGIDDNNVCSPTFSLVNEYRGGLLTLYHFDMYRITDYESLESTGFFDYMGNNSVIAIEWSENISDCLPRSCIYITIEIIDGDKRRIIIEGDERFADTRN